MAVLDVHNVTFGYGAAPTVRDISLSVSTGETVALLGGNGAGKSTVLKLIVGLERPWSGSIEIEGAASRRHTPHKMARAGVRLVPQGHPVFRSLTVQECLRVAADISGVTKKFGTKLSIDEALELFPKLKQRLSVHASALSGGERALLAVAQPLIAGSSLLLLDEPSAGLSPAAMAQLFDTLETIGASAEVTMLIVEQNAYSVLPICQRAYVMSDGQITLQGPASAIQADEKMVDAYLAY